MQAQRSFGQTQTTEKKNIELHKIIVRELTKGYADNNENGVRAYGGKLDVRPPFQREFVYKEKQCDAVIDTLTQVFPLNVMCWACRDASNASATSNASENGSSDTRGVSDDKTPRPNLKSLTASSALSASTATSPSTSAILRRLRPTFRPLTNGGRPHHPVASRRQDRCRKLPDALQGMQSEEKWEIKCQKSLYHKKWW